MNDKTQDKINHSSPSGLLQVFVVLFKLFVVLLKLFRTELHEQQRQQKSMLRSICVLSLFLSHGLFLGCGGQGQLVELVRESQKELTECRNQLATVTTEVIIESQKSKLLMSKINAQEAQTLQMNAQKKSNAESMNPHSIQEHITSLNDESARILRKIDQALLVRLAQEIGADVQPLSKSVLFNFGGVKSQVVFTPKESVLTSHTRFKGYTADLKFINHWNRTRRFSRVYLDIRGDTVIEAELDIEPGVSEEALKAWLRSYGVVINFFQVSLHQNEQKRQKTRPKRERI